MCKETSESAMHRSEVYSIRVGPKGLALSRFPVIKKKKTFLIKIFKCRGNIMINMRIIINDCLVNVESTLHLPLNTKKIYQLFVLIF
jgi:hypothetical protein